MPRPLPRPSRSTLIWLLGLTLGVAAGGAAVFLLAGAAGSGLPG